MTVETHRASLLRTLGSIVGERHVLTRRHETRRYRTGFRFGSGEALAVVKPGTLYEQWRVLEECVRADVIVIAQASNTGLTGGSTPTSGGYDRDVVIVNTARITAFFVIDEGRQVICLPGTTLHALERRLRPLGREPHSIIGSSCLGASVIGGICNNSGGALTRRGPAFTQMALFARADQQGRLELVNHLGISLGDTPEDVLHRLQAGQFDARGSAHPSGACSDHTYGNHVRDVDADTPARFNADPRRLFEASGSAGKLMVFAVRLDTYALERDTKVFYVGTDDPAHLGQLRRRILKECRSLPIAGEYLHRDAFDLADRYGKDQFLLIERIGTDRLPGFFELKSRCDDLCARVPGIPASLVDRCLYALGRLWPDHLPARLREYRRRFEHHLILRVSADAADEMRSLLAQWARVSRDAHFECSEVEARKAFLHRFVVAGAAVRYRAIHEHEVQDIIALDVALRRNDEAWFESLPPDIAPKLLAKIYYGHFLCHVFHQDYIVAKGNDCIALEHRMLQQLDERGARYPAEHNVGHVYAAEPALLEFYRSLDPGNRFNAGIGQSSKWKNYANSTSTCARDHANPT